MTTKDELEQAVATRDAKRKANKEELPKRINEFLNNTLAKAIAEDETAVSIVFARGVVS